MCAGTLLKRADDSSINKEQGVKNNQKKGVCFKTFNRI